MMKDTFKNYLADLGYNIIAHPKTSIKVLDLLSKEGTHLAALSSPLELLFKPDLKPKPSKKSGAADINGQKAFEFDVKTNLGLLSGLFQAIGLSDSDLKAKASGKNNLKVTFNFEKITEETVDLLDLDNYLTGAIPLEGEFRTYEERLKRSELYVITTVLRSASFSVEVTDETGREVAFDASVNAVATGKISIDRQANNRFSIVNHQGEALAFAFKAAQILYDKASWFQFWKPSEAQFRIKNQLGLVLKSEEDFPIAPLELGDQPADI